MTALAHELAGLIGPLHGAWSPNSDRRRKKSSAARSKRANASSAAAANATERRAGKTNAALHAPLQGRAYAAPAGPSQSPAVLGFGRLRRNAPVWPAFGAEIRRRNSQWRHAQGASASLPPVHALLAIVAPRIEAILQLALLVDVVEGQIAERDQNDDRNQREQVAAPACLRLLVLVARRGLAHAKRLEARWSMSPSAAIALATMPLASSPAAAYMRSGLS